MKLGEAMYKAQAEAEGAAGDGDGGDGSGESPDADDGAPGDGGPGDGGDETIVDADFEEVDDDKKSEAG